MAQYNFKGAIENISERQLEFIHGVIVEQGFKGSKVTFNSVGIAGDNYVANVVRLSIEGENGTMSMIAKVAPSNEALRTAIKVDQMFNNEHVMYTKVLPKLVQLQKSAGVPGEEQLRYAKCYGSLTEQPNEVILLEDLKTSNFIMLDRFQSLSDECVRSILKNFSILHSLSFVLKYKEPQTFDYYKASLLDMWASEKERNSTKQYFKMMEDAALAVLQDSDHKNIVRNKVADIHIHARKLAKLDNGSKYIVIQQGDSWTNNIMFRFEEDAVKESIMIDYQLSRANNPVCDILYMIFNCTDHDTRSKLFYDWIDYYHSELDKSLSNFGLKANFVYSRDQLDADLKRYSKLIFGLSIVLSSFFTTKSEDADKIKEAMVTSEQTQMPTLDSGSMGLFRNRIVGLIDSYKDFGFF